MVKRRPNNKKYTAVMIKHGKEGRDLIAMRVVGCRHVVLRDPERVPGDQLIHPQVVPVNVLRDLHVRPDANWGLEVHPGAGNLPLLAVADAVVQVPTPGNAYVIDVP